MESSAADNGCTTGCSGVDGHSTSALPLDCKSKCPRGCIVWECAERWIFLCEYEITRIECFRTRCTASSMAIYHFTSPSCLSPAIFRDQQLSHRYVYQLLLLTKRAWWSLDSVGFYLRSASSLSRHLSHHFSPSYMHSHPLRLISRGCSYGVSPVSATFPRSTFNGSYWQC